MLNGNEPFFDEFPLSFTTVNRQRAPVGSSGEGYIFFDPASVWLVAVAMLERPLMCCSPEDGHKPQGKLKASVTKRNGKEEKNFKPTRKGGKWTIALCVGGEHLVSNPNFGEKQASQSRSFKIAHKGPIQAMCLLIVCSK